MEQMTIHLGKSEMGEVEGPVAPRTSHECNLHSHVTWLIIKVVAYAKPVFPQFTLLFPSICSFHPYFLSRCILLYDSMIVCSYCTLFLKSIIKTQVAGLLVCRNYQVITPFCKYPFHSIFALQINMKRGSFCISHFFASRAKSLKFPCRLTGCEDKGASLQSRKGLWGGFRREE